MISRDRSSRPHSSPSHTAPLIDAMNRRLFRIVVCPPSIGTTFSAHTMWFLLTRLNPLKQKHSRMAGRLSNARHGAG